MKKIYGAQERQDGLYCIGRNKWELIYGFGKDSPDDESGYNYRQRFTHKPTLKEIEDIIKSTINAETDAKIISGFVWRGMPVWLSQENQFNYKTAYDLAVQLNGANLPIKFKFGTDDEPQYFIFDNMEDFADFFIGASNYVNETLNAGWSEKDWVHTNINIFNC